MNHDDMAEDVGFTPPTLDDMALATLIEDAWGAIGSAHINQPEGAINRSVSPTQLQWTEEGVAYVVVYADLRKMMVMELGHLPLKSIALPVSLMPDVAPSLLNEPMVLDFSHKLTDFFSSYVTAALYELQSLCRKGNIKAFIIGGQVRDMLLMRDQRFDEVDVDVTVEANAIEVSQFLVSHSKNFTVDECFPEFGTVTLLYKGDVHFDLASTRQETYEACGALPTVLKRGVPLSFDVSRRDFTVNTLAMSIDSLGQVIDHTGGLKAIERREIALLHTASFFEDPSRILRAFKFLTRLDFKLAPLTEYCMERFMDYAHWVYPGGGDRIRSEMSEFFTLDETSVKRMWFDYFLTHQHIRLANTALPSVMPQYSKAAERIIELSEHQTDVSELLSRLTDSIRSELSLPDVQWLLYLWISLHSLITEHIEQVDDKSVAEQETLFMETAKRLELTKEHRVALIKAQRMIGKNGFEPLDEDSTPVDVCALFRHYSLPSLIIAALVLHFNEPHRLDLVFNAIQRYFRVWKQTKPVLTGDDIMALGIPQGEKIGAVLDAILHEKLMGRLFGADDETQFVRDHYLPRTVSKTFATNPVAQAKSDNRLTPPPSPPSENPDKGND